MSLSQKKGARLKEAREDAKITQEQLAEYSDYASKYISALENSRKNFSYDAAHKFSKILHVRAEWLMCEDDFKTERDKWDHDRKIFYAERSGIAEAMRNYGYIVELNGDKFIILQTDEAFLEEYLPGWEIEDNEPLICSAEIFRKFSDHFAFMKASMIYSFLKSCSIGTEEDKIIAEKLQQRRDEKRIELERQLSRPIEEMEKLLEQSSKKPFPPDCPFE